jgi:hypothetical protein
MNAWHITTYVVKCIFLRNIQGTGKVIRKIDVVSGTG